MNIRLATLGLLFFVSCTGGKEQGAQPTTPSSASPSPMRPTGKVTGKILFAGKAPAGVPIKMSADPACAKLTLGKTVLKQDIEASSDGGLKNVLVYVKEGVSPDQVPATLPPPAALDQRGCLYSPSIVALRVGQPLKILNADPTLHNVNVISSQGQGFNTGMPQQDQIIERKFSKPERMIRVKCDVHGWMGAHIAVFDHPYFAVTSDGGGFTLEQLPLGDYLIEAWHENLGTKTHKVSLKAAATPETLTISF